MAVVRGYSSWSWSWAAPRKESRLPCNCLRYEDVMVVNASLDKEPMVKEGEVQNQPWYISYPCVLLPFEWCFVERDSARHITGSWGDYGCHDSVGMARLWYGCNPLSQVLIREYHRDSRFKERGPLDYSHGHKHTLSRNRDNIPEINKSSLCQKLQRVKGERLTNNI